MILRALSKPQTHLAKFQGIAILQVTTAYRLPINPYPVGGTQIDDGKSSITSLAQFGMMGGYGIIIQPYVIIKSPADAGHTGANSQLPGGGTTLLAAERTGRIARAVEIAPAYVDVALKRFRQNVPDAPITLAATGQTFEAVAEERGISSDSAPAGSPRGRHGPDRRPGAPA